MKTVADRFWSKVQKTDGCWLWLGQRDRDGYGLFRGPTGRRATHTALLLDGRPLSPGQWALHRCDTPACVRPGHLFAGDGAANVADKVSKGRQAKGSAITDGRRNTTGADHWTRRQPQNVLRGERHGRVTVSDEGVAEIRRRFLAGESRADLARSFNVTWTTVTNFIRGRTRSQTSIFDLAGAP